MKTKVIAAAAVVAILVSAWIFGGKYNGRGGQTAVPPPPSPAESFVSQAEVSIKPTATPKPEMPEATQDISASVSPEPEPGARLPTAPTDEPSPTQDKYKTEPPPSGMPAPVEPQDAVAGDGSFTVTLSVKCDTILGNMNLLDKAKWELVPDGGVIFPAADVTAHEGESVFNVLQRELKRAKIHLEFMNTPIYNSAYIEGINNLYEFDVGELSGWMYRVNGWFPNYGCSRYLLKPGDAVEWVYTCDLGRDVGEEYLGGAQRGG